MGSILGIEALNTLVPVFAAGNSAAKNQAASGGDGDVDAGTVNLDNYKSKKPGAMWKQFGNGIVGIFTGIRPFVIALVVVALVVDGIGCIIGGEQSREKFKRALPWVIGGAVVILLSLSIAEGVINGISSDDNISTILPMLNAVMVE